jgi:anti-sigma factor RsiW
MSDYVDGDLDAESRRRLERHVRWCHRCHTVLDNLRRTLERLRGLGGTVPEGEDPEAVAARVARAWRERA